MPTAPLNPLLSPLLDVNGRGVSKLIINLPLFLSLFGTLTQIWREKQLNGCNNAIDNGLN